MPKKFRPDVRGFNQVMKSDATRAELSRLGNQFAAEVGDGFESVSDNRHPWVAREFVQPATPAAHRANARDKLIMRALGKRLG
ncbi:hypothetical protein H490_0103915 [Leucobacter sp. UCD-THU]|uniref:hypothetical protein n=1 Tax=Leucobacter sp. UCD-THU TaxID=1292023 RepID=UPI000372A6B5|nr:hypothetical protein [Leucobacter sp. UCD-THU]EYT56030.1 hypothetical protein H490_0103915 [Leucobacter sp. UCD-THU]